MNEEWRDIQGFEGKYQVSNLGNIKSYVESTKHKKEIHLLKPYTNNSGYKVVRLYYGKGKQKSYLVHVLVATAFLPNPDNYPCVNHKDEDKLNNCVDNLEWCTYQYNNAYGTASVRTFITKRNPVEQFTVDGIWLATYHSPSIAARLLNISSTAIYNCCKGKTEYACGYKWRYTQYPQ